MSKNKKQLFSKKSLLIAKISGHLVRVSYADYVPYNNNLDEFLMEIDHYKDLHLSDLNLDKSEKKEFIFGKVFNGESELDSFFINKLADF